MTTIELLREKAHEVLTDWDLVSGLGDVDYREVCTMAALNVAVEMAETGKLPTYLTAEPPECACPVICRWVIATQDMMPLEVLRSGEWRDAALLILGSRSNFEVEKTRRYMILDWMWARLRFLATIEGALPSELFPAWRRMVTERTEDSVSGAVAAIQAYSTSASLYLSSVLICVQRAISAPTPEGASSSAAQAATEAIRLARVSERDTLNFWADANPVGMLNQLTAVR